MNKTAIKNFAIWARNKLIADITYKAGLLGVTDKKVKEPLSSSTKDVLFFDIGTMEPYAVTGIEIEERKKLAEIIEQKAKQSDYATAYKAVVEEVAYTWFNRLIAVRFMEVNDYLPSHIRVLSSESETKIEPDLVTTPFDAGLDFTPYEKDRIVQLKNDNQLDELFRMLFIKQCNTLNGILPELFETTSDYTELLLNINCTDKDGVVYRLVHDISEDDFNVSKEGQVEIIGWLYQYYNTEPKDEAFALLKKNVKITKERIPAATQLFTPDWIVRYMVENSLGRLWLEHERASDKLSDEYLNASYFGWKYYLEDAKQEPEVEAQLEKIREEYKNIKPEDIKVIDPCMGSGHILVYAFDVLMQIYESYGYSQRDAARSILEHNIYGLDIDNRAYQLAYFAVLMKARQYNRRILDGKTQCHVYAIQESNSINRDQLKYFGAGMEKIERNTAILQVQELLDTFTDAKEYGSILNVENYNWDLLQTLVGGLDTNGQMKFDAIGIENTKSQLSSLVKIGKVLAQKYDVVVTNPPYMSISNGNNRLIDYVKSKYTDSKTDLFSVFIERCGLFVKKNCFQAMITQHAWMFLSSFEKLRKKLQLVDMINMAHLGPRAFEEIGGEVVQTTSFITRKSNVKGSAAIFVRLIDYSSQKLKERAFLERNDQFISKREYFSKIPGIPIAYWITQKIVKAFENPALVNYALPKQGFATGNNDRFLRLWYEVSSSKSLLIPTRREDCLLSKKKWFPCNKGGTYKKWYGNNNYLANWEDDGHEMRSFSGAVIRNPQFYFNQGITWSTIANNLSMRYSPEGFIFETKGSVCFVNDNKNIYYLLGLLNSKIIGELLLILSPTLDYHEGPMAKLPVILEQKKSIEINEIVKQNIYICKFDWDAFETSWDFTKHPLIAFRSMSVYEVEPYSGRIQQAYNNWNRFVAHQFTTLKSNEEELNRIFIDIYGLQDELTPEVEDKDVTVVRIYDAKEDIPESMKGNNYVLTKGDVIRSFISYAVGCMFGRYSFDVDGLAYAGGQWDDSKYSTFIPDKDNVLPITDEEYFEDDIVGLFVAFVKKVYCAETLEENLDFIAEALGNKGDTSREVIRNYFLRDFFKDHCKTYQKRPIYWLFDSGKADGFKALIYMHRYNENTIGDMRIDYLHRMQRVYESEIARMQETINNSTNAREVTAAEKRKEKLIKQLKETKDYDEKIAHLALARTPIDLDDGVKVNYEKVQTGTDSKKLDVLAGI